MHDPVELRPFDHEPQSTQEVIDVLAVRNGTVPGGAPLVALTVGLAAAGAGYGALKTKRTGTV